MSYLDSTKHTPGPWQFWKGQVHPDQHETMGVMRPGRSLQIQLEHEPDLHLIAAAPELLAACKALQSALLRWDDNGLQLTEASRMATAAIAKAEGANP